VTLGRYLNNNQLAYIPSGVFDICSQLTSLFVLLPFDDASHLLKYVLCSYLSPNVITGIAANAFKGLVSLKGSKTAQPAVALPAPVSTSRNYAGFASQYIDAVIAGIVPAANPITR
jgi:hypothetical protein